jgi:hypothetical protein
MKFATSAANSVFELIMCTAIALVATELPVELAERLGDRKHSREGREEYQFHWWQTPTILPVRWDGKLVLLPWGSKSRRGPLPCGGWVSQDHVSGIFSEADEVVIPANVGFQKGTWFLILEGIRGVVVQTRDGPVVYMLTTSSTNYYRNMTEQSPAMPVLVNQTI